MRRRNLLDAAWEPNRPSPRSTPAPPFAIDLVAMTFRMPRALFAVLAVPAGHQYAMSWAPKRQTLFDTAERGLVISAPSSACGPTRRRLFRRRFEGGSLSAVRLGVDVLTGRSLELRSGFAHTGRNDTSGRPCGAPATHRAVPSKRRTTRTLRANVRRRGWEILPRQGIVDGRRTQEIVSLNPTSWRRVRGGSS